MFMRQSLKKTFHGDAEEEAIRLKELKQKLAQKRFAKEKFYISKQEREQQYQIDVNDQQSVKKVYTKSAKYERLKKEYQNFDIELSLLEEGVDFNNPEICLEWLPLQFYDDVTLEQLFIDGNINFTEVFTDDDGTLIKATARAFTNLQDQQIVQWIPVDVLGYNENKQKFRCVYEDGTKKLIPRIYLCFDIEEPRQFVKRVAIAFQKRLYADSLIRFKFYISSMPTDHLSEVSAKTKKNLETLVRNKRLEHAEVTALFMEISSEYSYTMNSIIFEKYLNEQNQDLVPHQLVLPPKEEELLSQVPEKGMLLLEKDKGAKEIVLYSPYEIYESEARDFTEIFKEFCLSSFLITPEAISALQQIRTECNKILDYEFFKLLRPQQPQRLDEFKSDQETEIDKIVNRLRLDWVPNVEKIIFNEFSESDKGWLNLKETNKVAYEGGKLKKFFNLVIITMQDSLLTLCQKSFKNFQLYLSQYVPEKVSILKPNHVINEYKDNVIVDSKNPNTLISVKSVKPLFTIELMKNNEDQEFFYSTQPKYFLSTIQMLFDKLVNELQKIPSVERSLMQDLFRKTSQLKEIFIKSPKRQVNDGEVFISKEDQQFDENKWVNELFALMTQELEQSIQPLDEYLKQYDPYKPLLQLNPEEYCQGFDDKENPKDISVITTEIENIAKKEKALVAIMPDIIQVSSFEINCKDTTQYLQNKYAQTQKLLIELIANRGKTMTSDLFKEIGGIKQKLTKPPENIEELTNITDKMAIIPSELEKMKKEIEKSMEIYQIMENYNFKFTEDELKKKWLVFGGPKEIVKTIEDQKAILEKEKHRFKDRMEHEQENFKTDIEEAERIIQNFHTYTNIKDHGTVSGVCRDLAQKIKEFTDKAKKFNNQEQLFEKELTDYSKITQIKKDFDPYYNLWTTSNQWFKNIEVWRNGPWNELNAIECEKFVDNAFKTYNQVIKFFKDKDIQGVLKIAQAVKSQVDAFRPQVPLMVALRKNGMKERHWKQVSDKVGFKVEPTEDFTFTKLIDMGLLTHLQFCEEVGERASKEFSIESSLKEMKAKWEEIKFDLKSWKASFIIRGYDEINTVLDEHIVNTQSMQFSPFKKPFEEELIEWNDSLKLMSLILEEWAKYQMNWMYLQPIFDSPDIAKQLPGETKKFKTVDQNWKHTMNYAKQTQSVFKVCQMEGLLEKLQDGNKNLDMIQKELNNYLERKRERFARFYFLSNDELLEILSQTKEPTAVQPHLRKVFENIAELEFDDSKKMHAMFSAEKEKVPFVKYIDPINKNVEDWMNEVEEMMKESVKSCLLKSVKDYYTKPRDQWVLNHPGQCILNGSQIVWTQEVEEAIKANQVTQFWEKSQEQLICLVELVRQKLTKQQKVTINALIVLDVHAKDVVKNLEENKVTEIGAFEWISQLRYYWENNDCRVKCVQTNFPYGYEYLGNTLRLVITPLTDKCYMTLMGALKLNLGGAPAGPAGTGKTESVKDLAKGLAKQCVVFNCSDSMDYIMVGKFFKGLASAGAWCCFDEFNRINIEVLSVIAQQLLILFGEKAKGSEFVENFEGSDIKLKPTFCVFITMNPGYAGRTELPDNLKALFRSVAMMVPDYALIGEIMLYSFGFKLGRDLAKKMVVTFKLSSEQLSSQDHYDYGMRAVRSVINAAGLLKAADPDMDENQLLLRALRDVNVPKFLKDDLPLFENIIQDLFPGVERPKIDYGELLSSITQTTVESNLQPQDSFNLKVLQLYDTIQVRHGLMLVGPTGGGKSSNMKVLSKALTKLEHNGFYKVHMHNMNPKSITMGQLYGQFNEQTREWNDGILAYTVREACRDQSSERHWIVFDGPVDAIWIENMNTVLDDNKKLCLNSGMILTLTPYMTMMFEVEDLLVASPATVSRCGMVYMEPISLGLKPLFQSWINTLPEKCDRPTIKKALEEFFDRYVEKSIEFLRQNCKEIVSTVDNNLTQSLFRVMNCYFANYKETEIKKVQAEDVDNFEQVLESYLIFSLVWSICCTVDYDGREKFSQFIRQLMIINKSKIQFPYQGMIYDYQFNENTKEFISWSENYKNFEIEKLVYNEIMIPTNDSTRNIYMMKLLLTNNYHVCFPGPTGTGKSLNAYSLLSNGLSDSYQYIALTFSAQTSANQTQDTIDTKLDRRRKGIYGPPIGKKCIIFVDDLNMPKKEEYGAQPPIELIRQYFDHGGWYNRKDLQFMRLDDLIILSAMGPPGGGRSNITNRCLRHFNVISYTDLDEDTIKTIFLTLINAFLNKFNENIRGMIPELVNTVLVVYYRVRNELLPTPRKSHYTFNLRDISKVFQGICSASNKHCVEPSDMAKLWYHENMRIFHDRLIDEEDREYLKDMLVSQFEKFNLTKEEVLSMDRIIFGDFWFGRETESRPYIQVPNLKQLMSKMEEFQEEYNQDPDFTKKGKAMMKLVLFLDACEHISRITRVLRQPKGNALLLGVGGSGRQSLSKMATFIAGYRLQQIEVIKNYNMRSWREDIKKILMMAGIDDDPVVFLFVDTQIINEQMLEDLNSILNSGDVTNLYQEKDIEEIVDACKSECIKRNLQPNKMNVFSQYLRRVTNNIHLVIAMSPLSSMFSTRLRMFPSLVNCCTLDWFTEWPEEALIGVGKGQLQDFQEEVGIENELADKLVESFKTIHKSVEKISVKYQLELRRINYVTPTSYLELLTMFKTIMKTKRVELKDSITRLKNGLDRLIDANIQVNEMQIQLTDMQPKLEQAAIDTEQMMKTIEIQQKEADEKQKIVSEEEAIATKSANEAQKLKDEAEKSVEEANKILDETLIEVSKLKKDHLVEVKSLPNPPSACITILGGMTILLQDTLKEKGGQIILRNIEGQIGKKEEDYFNTAKKWLLADPKELLDLLLNFKKENINQAYIKKLEEKILSHEDWSLEKAKTCSHAIKYIFSWCQAMYDFNKVFRETQPLRDKLEKFEKIVSEKMAELKIKKDALEEIQNKIKKLEEQFNETVAKKEKLTNDISECQLKLDRAQKLTSGLSDEKVRWSKDIEILQNNEILIPGDTVIGAGMVAYSGPFISLYRQILEKTWIKKLDELGVKHTAGITMSKFLGKPVLIQQWNLAGLPKDDTSIENGIIIEQSRRWPLMIDPQTQANKYIKNLGNTDICKSGIDVLKMSDSNLIKTLEMALRAGKWVLVENVGKDLDPSLEPILLQQFVKTNNGLELTLGEKSISVSPDFKFFMTSTNPNPHYSPETFVKVCIINFAITRQGMEDQMLAKVVELENPQLEQKKTEIVKRNAEDKKSLLQIEDEILRSLQASDDISELLMDESLINTLQNAKKFAAEINQRMQDSKITEQQIDKTREGYRPVAFRASLLFFCILDLNVIDPMYEYSLQWFSKLFEMGIENAPASKEHEVRLENLNKYFTYSLYENICRSLFEKHKLIFSLMLTVQIIQGDNKMNMEEWRYFLSGPSGDIKIQNNPTSWVDENSWIDMYRQIYGINLLPNFAGFEEFFMKNYDQFRPIFDSQNPHLDPLPEPWNSNLNDFQKIILLKAIRSDKIIPAVEKWIEHNQGREFIIPPIFDISKCFKDSMTTTPLIFVLSPGSDPVADFQRFSAEQEMENRIYTISLGQGQGPKAEKMIKEATQRGGWVLLQNCHLAISWMPDLERIVEDFNENLHKDFRLWLTSMPTKDFPISVLQNGVKMTLEPPQGLRANLKRSYAGMTEESLNDCKKPNEYKKLLFGFCFFHAIIQDRRKFGPIGWNIPYEFTMEDLTVCQRQLKMLLDEYEEIPYKVLNYLGAEINYGGRVTDDKDVLLIKSILKLYINPRILQDKHQFSKSGIYYSPEAGEHSDYMNYIEQLPLNPSPEVFGLHDNAEITNSQNLTRILLETILSVQPRTSSSKGQSREEKIEEIANFVQSRTPQEFNFEAIFQQYPTDYNESMNTVLVQEIVRYNRLLSIMKTSLINVKKALKGLVVMSEDLEKLANSLYDNQVPKLWAEKGFLSLKPLSSWTQDLNERITFLQNWIDHGTPQIFWISGFFFPQAFITGMLQNYARKNIIAIDKISFKFDIIDSKTHNDIKEKPDTGCYIYGMFIEGARWDHHSHQLQDSNPKELFSNLPLIHLVPVVNRVVQKTGFYSCPLYKVVSRAGTLSTTGHSTNFVMFLELPSDRDESIWIVAGVAAFLALRY
ncbi:hypothetical protein ABPG72_011341 [Tetrahymena utriculariae]